MSMDNYNLVPRPSVWYTHVRVCMGTRLGQLACLVGSGVLLQVMWYTRLVLTIAWVKCVVHVWTSICLVLHNPLKISLLPDLRSEVETSSHEYRDQVRELNKEERKQRLNKIQELFKKAMEYSDDKVQIAMQMYEMVSQLDTSLIPRPSAWCCEAGNETSSTLDQNR